MPESFCLRLCDSKRTFIMAFPNQRQEAFHEGHAEAFRLFQGVPHRVCYDTLKTTVPRVPTGRNRQEQSAFAGLRSHYLFESRFCTPGEAHDHELWEVREDVRRNVEALAPGGGFVLGTIHNTQANVPPANLVAMCEAFREYGAY